MVKQFERIVHEHTLRMNITNLRKLVSPFGLHVAFEQDGYRLEVPASFVFVLPRAAI